MATRIPVLRFEPTQAEVRAVMRWIAEQGHPPLSKEQCSEICEYLIVKSAQSEYNLDIRLLMSAFRDYIHCLEKEAKVDWKDLVDSTMEKAVSPATKKDDLDKQRAIALEVRKQGGTIDEQITRFKAKTGKSKDAYYARLKELKAQGEKI